MESPADGMVTPAKSTDLCMSKCLPREALIGCICAFMKKFRMQAIATMHLSGDKDSY